MLFLYRYDVQVYSEDVNAWFSNAVGRPCSLLRCNTINRNSVCPKENGNAATCRDVKSQLNFTNEAQFLLISEESFSDLDNRLSAGNPAILNFYC